MLFEVVNWPTSILRSSCQFCCVLSRKLWNRHFSKLKVMQIQDNFSLGLTNNTAGRN